MSNAMFIGGLGTIQMGAVSIAYPITSSSQKQSFMVETCLYPFSISK
ncbi:hypothetical protein [Clostridium estertheticum]|nr:hypothetical protein [Clostridium estertheticum]MBU3172720.1 hypothetical protein [Clostridium estertheticum]